MSPDKENAHYPSPSAFAPHSSKPSRKMSDSGRQSDARAMQAGKRRRAAADWIESLTGVAVSATSDRHFRESLKDGTLLCQVLNIIRPGCITQVIAMSAKQLTEAGCTHSTRKGVGSSSWHSEIKSKQIVHTQAGKTGIMHT